VNPTISLKYTVTLSNCSGRTISPAISCWATGLKIYINLSYIALCYQLTFWKREMTTKCTMP
jgi:hypothetical protein